MKEGRPSSEGEHSFEVTREQPAVRLAPRRRAPAGRAERRRATGAGVDPRVRVERQHRASRRLQHPTRSHSSPSATRGSSGGTTTRAVPNAGVRNYGWMRVGAEAAHRGPEPQCCVRPSSIEDIGALRLHDPTGRHRPVIAAGAPWYMTLFGRDALISSYMALPIDPTLALGVLEALAELQGREVDAASEEEPGRIMHETRYLGVDAPTLTGGNTYYGSVDATPLFVFLLGELSRWGLAGGAAAPIAAARRPGTDVDGRVRRPRRRRLHRVPEDVRTRSGATRVGRTPPTASAITTEGSPRRRWRCARCRPTPMRRTGLGRQSLGVWISPTSRLDTPSWPTS